MQNPKRTLFIGLIVGLLFFGWWFRGFLYINWNFNLFSWESWQFLFQEIKAGWRVSNTGDWIFLLSFILVIPMYFGLWHWANKIKWGTSIKKAGHLSKKHIQVIKKKTHPKKKESTHAEQPSHTSHKSIKAPPISAQRPMPMPTMGHTMKTQPIQPQNGFQSMPTQQDTPFANEFTTQYPTGMDTPNNPPDAAWSSMDSDLKQMADTPLDEIQLPSTQIIQEDINALLQNNGWTILSDITLDDKKPDWLAVCQGQMLWIACDDEEGDWLADEEAFNDEDPLWFSETDHRVSPVFTLIQQTKVINQKLEAAHLILKVQPVLIERKGNLINAEDMLKTWNDLGVIVCRTDVGGPVELKTATEVFNKPCEPLPEGAIQQLKEILS